VVPTGYSKLKERICLLLEYVPSHVYLELCSAKEDASPLRFLPFFPPGGRRAMLQPPKEKLQVQAFLNRDRKIKQIRFAWYCCWVAACICDQCEIFFLKSTYLLQLKQTERDTISRALLPVRVPDMTKTDTLSYCAG
jgi:hypothetical protein